jgi:hypothetical protein
LRQLRKERRLSEKRDEFKQGTDSVILGEYARDRNGNEQWMPAKPDPIEFTEKPVNDAIMMARLLAEYVRDLERRVKRLEEKS